jgi:uncharacterized membrane protein YesL
MLPTSDLNDNLFFRIFNYGYWFLLTNVYLFLFFLPLLVLLQFHLNYSNLFNWIILLIAMCPIGPALTAAFSAMGKLVREGHVSITKEFFTGLKSNFFQSIAIWFIQLLIFTILVANIYLMKNTTIGSYLLPFFYVLLILNLLICLYLYPAISRFYLSTKSALKLAVGFTFFKIRITLLMLFVLGLLGLIIFSIPSISLFFLIGPFCFIVMFLQRGLMEKLEKSIKLTNNNI